MPLQPANATIPLRIARIHVEGAGGAAESPHLPVALRYFDEALRINPRCEDALVEKGAALAMAHRDDEAEAVFRSALALRPDSLHAVNFWAQLLLYRGKDAEALTLVEAGLAIEPGYRDLLALRARIEKKAGPPR